MVTFEEKIDNQEINLINTYFYIQGVNKDDNNNKMSWAVSYKYSLPDYYSLADYGMEAQASLIADYFILSRYGRERWFEVKLMQGIIGPDLKSFYEFVLKGFFHDPTDRKNLK